ncbi:MAG: hypothetical protein ACKO8U_07645 [Pirellula sp.]
MITPDHPTPVSTKKHSHGWVPFTIAGKGIHADGSRTYDEVSAAQSDFRSPTVGSLCLGSSKANGDWIAREIYSRNSRPVKCKNTWCKLGV